jgi:GT2 family glycosyltransferase
VAVALLNWRQAEATLQVLEDLRASGYPELTVLVMDNGSGDGSSEILRQAVEQEELQVFDQNLGYCAAMNRGIDWAEQRGVDYLLFLNNDMRLPAGFLEQLVQVLDNDASLSCVGPTILDAQGKVWSQGGRVGFHPNALWLCGQGAVPSPEDAGPEAVDFMPGACALYRLSDLRELGGLDESYFMYVEDVDLGLRIKEKGKKVLWLPWVRVVHEASLSSGGGRTPLRKYMSGVNSLRLLRRHGGPKTWAAFLIYDLLLWPFSLLSGEIAASWAKARGICAGLLGRKLDAGVVERFVPRASNPESMR